VQELIRKNEAEFEKRVIDGEETQLARRWEFDTASIFAQIDAFVQRCRDLLEICEGQLQWAGSHAKVVVPLPVFGAARGPEVVKALQGIEDKFQLHIYRLSHLNYQILDVNMSSWHDDYNRFKIGVKDLEVMMVNVITTAFETCETVSDGVMLLEAFSQLAKRNAIQHAVEKKTADVYTMFKTQMDDTRREFDNKRSDVQQTLSTFEATYAGSAIWAKSLRDTVESTWELLESAAFYLVGSRRELKAKRDEVQTAYDALMTSLMDYIKQRYDEWCATLTVLTEDGALLADLLNRPLIKRMVYSDAPGKGGRGAGAVKAVAAAGSTATVRRGPSGELASDFDQPLLQLFNEVFFWERLGLGGMPIPYAAHDISGQKEKLRVVREYVMLLVADYNAILHALTPEERRLFDVHIRRLDQRVSQGLGKMTWATKNIVEWYVKNCRQLCSECYKVVCDFKAGKDTVRRCCRTIASTLLIKIERNNVYEHGEFELKQREHGVKVKALLQEVHGQIRSTMQEMYAAFAEHSSSEVQREWRSFVLQVDQDVEQALRATVKRSLQSLSRAINGDHKTRADPQTLFKIDVVLEKNERVEFKPTLIQLTQVVNAVSKDLITVIAVVPRLKDVLAMMARKPKGVRIASDGEAADGVEAAAVDADGEARPSEADAEANAEADAERAQQAAAQAAAAAAAQVQQESFYELISNDDDMLKILVTIMNGMSSTATAMQKHLSEWAKYKPIWETDKDAFIRRYAKADRPLSQYDADISAKKETEAEVQAGNYDYTINFIKIDCTRLKAALVTHCQQWQNKLTSLLNKSALAQLSELHSMFKETTDRLAEKPGNLGHLSDSLLLLEQRKKDADAGQIKSQFGPLEEKYATLLKFDVQATDAELSMVATLRTAYADYVAMLSVAHSTLDKSKVNMKMDLQAALGAFLNHCVELRAEALTLLPFGMGADSKSSVEQIEEALSAISVVQEKVSAARAKETALMPGLSIFKIPQPNPKELLDTEKELGLLDQIWGLQRGWAEQWDSWKSGRFANLDPVVMAETVGTFRKEVAKLGRSIKTWGVWSDLERRLRQFMDTMPLIEDLKSQAIRPRHWTALQAEVGKEFEPQSSSFTLEKVFSLNLHHHSEFIGEMSANANKELQIEVALADIEERWQEISINLAPYKDKYFKVQSTEDLYQFLEDDQVSVSTMKASKFYPSFQDRINRWEAALSTVSEVMELLLSVQRAWIYLESIFMASEDIQKQLPEETKMFREVNFNFIALMQGVSEDPNAMHACQQDGMLESVTNMEAKLDKIQKSLDQYLETKRMVFPRFYFLSNDDLLEILGQSRDPAQVQKHIKKCFEGVKTLALITTGAGGANGAKKGAKETVEAEALVSGDKETIGLVRNVILEGAVEMWLVQVEKAMQLALQKALRLSVEAYKGKKEKWIKEYPGQLLITTGTIVWTLDCAKGLNEISKGNKGGLRKLKKKQVSYLNKLTDMVRGQLTKVERSKLVALITMEIHSRDVIERMIKANCTSVQDFDWLSQLRMVFEKDDGEFGINMVKQTNCILEYSYEYQGNNGRLVVTPLTDRCVLTLNTAMFLHRGGNPLGPAGTGKTETVKDLGKNLAKYVVVINCSDGLDYKSVGQMFSGLCQSGAWGCFDEFNRIIIEVLSVVAMQILSIMNALAEHAPSFNFMGKTIGCNPNCGIFITMNPGYAGRTELPDNLKALTRPVAMMAPDLALIAEVMLSAEGFREARGLAKKTITLYGLMIQQLSKQDHYDYGLRNLKAVLNCAGGLKRADSAMNEEAILMRALRDMNLPKFIADDLILFRGLLMDLFPSLELPVNEAGPLMLALERDFTAKGLQKHPYLLAKTIELYDSKETRHCNMLVGNTLCGKSVVWNGLKDAKTSMAREDKAEGYVPVIPYVINPKAITLSELYGAYDLATFEWQDGILSTQFKVLAESDRPEEKWVMFDGPVDTLWIESMNSTMDDNKVLTLINGDRIVMSATMSLLFEVKDLSQASPATVSRAGMIYIDEACLGWEPFVQSWLEKRFTKEGAAKAAADGAAADGADAADAGRDMEAIAFFKGMFDRYVVKIFAAKRSMRVVEPVKITDFSAVRSLCTLYDCLEASEPALDRESAPADYLALAEKVFIFAVVWSVMGAADEAGRLKLDAALRDAEAQFPPVLTVYDYFVDGRKKEWESWETKVPQWRPFAKQSFHSMIVPTVDTVRSNFVVACLLAKQKHVLVVGETGTGKTVLCQQQIGSLPETHAKTVLNFSAATLSIAAQEALEMCMEKRSKDKFGPAGGKQLVVFVDDFNMPTKDAFDSQPPLELLRQWIDYGGWYDRAKCVWRYMLDTQLLCAMAPPAGGRAVISERTQSRFSLINMTFPADAAVARIFESILTPRLSELDDEIKAQGPAIVSATLAVYQSVVERFLPTPVNSHYLFNLRDVAKVVQGTLQASRASVDTREALLRLWVHESLRVFADRFTSQADGDRFRELLDTTLQAKLDSKWEDLMAECPHPTVGPVFGYFMFGGVVEEGQLGPYEECRDLPAMKMRLEEVLEDYNNEPKLLAMDLVLFSDAIGHVCRIHRLLMQPRGNALLIGVGGSGRQSLTRLASYVAEYACFSIEITKNYRDIEFREDLKKLYLQAGVQNKPTVFLFGDTQIKQESFVEDINNVLSSGDVPGLFKKEELPEVFDACRKQAQLEGLSESPDSLYEIFITRVRSNLHVVLAMSPVGSSLRNRCRMFPGLVSCTTVDWFHPWPADALKEVGAKFLADIKLQGELNDAEREALRQDISTVFASVHISVSDASDMMLEELKRRNYVTPTNYLELVKGYRGLFGEKVTQVGASRFKLNNGLEKLEESQEQVSTMSAELEIKKETVMQSTKDCEELLVVIVSERRTADEQKKQVEAEGAKIAKETAETEEMAAEAQAELDVALPALEKAMAEVDKLNKGSISEVKQFTNPPAAVELCLAAVMTLFKGKLDWASARKKLSEVDFLSQVKNYDKDNVAESVINKIKKYVNNPDFSVEKIFSVNVAAGALCVWVHAIYTYSQVAKVVEPKRKKLMQAERALASKQEAQRAAQAKLDEVVAKVDALKLQYDTSVGEKNKLRKESEELQAKLARAEQLVSGLSGEYVRWQASVGTFDEQLLALTGDCLLGAAFTSYAGPFDSIYREMLMRKWVAAVNEREITNTASDVFNFAAFLAVPTDVRDWNIQGLPADEFSTENGVIVTRGNRWPLMIDPQGQANKWIKNMCGAELKVIDLKQKDFLRDVENAITFGTPVLLQDVLEELDPSLEPVLNRSLLKMGNRLVMKLGDKELDYSLDFKFYITTKLPNPHYTPEVSTKTTVVNFCVKQQGLEAQLLGIVVQQDKPSLEKQKSELVQKVANGKRKLVELEDTILRLLSESTGSLLDDADLVNTLNQSKVTSEAVKLQLEVAEETEISIDLAREGYRSAAIRSSIVFFVLNDLSKVDPMYQVSLARSSLCLPVRIRPIHLTARVSALRSSRWIRTCCYSTKASSAPAAAATAAPTSLKGGTTPSWWLATTPSTRTTPMQCTPTSAVASSSATSSCSRFRSARRSCSRRTRSRRMSSLSCSAAAPCSTAPRSGPTRRPTGCRTRAGTT
jgi:dynein heavy chain